MKCNAMQCDSQPGPSWVIISDVDRLFVKIWVRRTRKGLGVACKLLGILWVPILVPPQESIDRVHRTRGNQTSRRNDRVRERSSEES